MLKKLSLAALVAMGSMSFAGATDLSQAIQGVQLKGQLRIRFYNESDKTLVDKSKKEGYNRWRTTADFIFITPVDENLKVVNQLSTDASVYSNSNQLGNKSDVTPKLGEIKMYLDYSNNGLHAIVGKIPVSTPVTGKGHGEARGTGAIATYTTNGFTVAGAYVDALVGTDAVPVKGLDTYAAAAIYSNEAFGTAQVWYFNIENLIDSDVVVSADITALKDAGIKLHADYATANLDDSVSKDTQTYFNVNASYSANGLSAQLGYAATDEDGGVVALDADAPIAVLGVTQQKYGINGTADTSAVYANASFKADKATVYAGVLAINDDTAANNDDTDTIVGVKYAYTKKLGVHVYYDMLDSKNGVDNNEFRFEARYKF